MKVRLPLIISENRLILSSFVSCDRLRIRKQYVEFVVDTGSPYSFISYGDALKFQIPLSQYTKSEALQFGGSTYNRVQLPHLDLYVFKEGWKAAEELSEEYLLRMNIEINALKTTKKGKEKERLAQMMPSIIGMDFLEKHKMGLFVNPSEKIAYLEMDV
ncbi:MAG: hypothetical protein ABIC95_03415 [archaeon]